jgi:hypothetical protein
MIPYEDNPTPMTGTSQEMRHSFVSLLSDSGVPIENIARMVGHAGGSAVMETVYRKQIRPVLLVGAEAMARLTRPGRRVDAHSPRRPSPE